MRWRTMFCISLTIGGCNWITSPYLNSNTCYEHGCCFSRWIGVCSTCRSHFMLFPIQLNVLQTYYCGMYAYRRSSADRSAMIRIRADLIRADLDQGQKVLLIRGFGSGSSVDRSAFSLSGSRLLIYRCITHADPPVVTNLLRSGPCLARYDWWEGIYMSV